MMDLTNCNEQIFRRQLFIYYIDRCNVAYSCGLFRFKILIRSSILFCVWGLLFCFFLLLLHYPRTESTSLATDGGYFYLHDALINPNGQKLDLIHFSKEKIIAKWINHFVQIISNIFPKNKTRNYKKIAGEFPHPFSKQLIDFESDLRSENTE